jgi:hypothetical protein
MRTQNISRWIGLFVLMVMIVGCAQSTQKTDTPYYLATPSLSTNSGSKLETITPTVTPLTMNTSSLTITPTAIPTLSAEDASKRLLELLSNNGGCRLPCLWGITPGKSTPQEAQILWSPLSSISSRILTLPPRFTFDKGAVRPAYIEGDLILRTEARYESEHLIVSRINFYARQEKKFVPSTGGLGLLSIFDSTTFGKRVEYYSLAHLLSEQGIPTSVMIATSGPPPIYEGGGGFEIMLLYPEQGIWVRYSTQQRVNVDGNVRGCPANAHIEMELYPPNDANSFYAHVETRQEMTIQKDWYKPLEEATSMTLEQFYETFRQPTDECIETPTKLWPSQ